MKIFSVVLGFLAAQTVTMDATGPADRLTVNDVLAEARSHLVRLAPPEALAALQRGALLIDTRSEDERRARGHVPGSMHIPLSVLEWRVDPDSGSQNDAIDSFDKHIILLCAQGYSSSLAARRLQQLGFRRATDVIGGFEAWERDGLSINGGPDSPS